MIAAQATLRRRHVDDALRRVEPSPHPVVRPPALGDERREVAERGAGELVAGRHVAVLGGQLGGLEARAVVGELGRGDAQRADVRAGDAQVLQRGGQRCRRTVVHAGGQVVDDLEDACRGRVARHPTDRLAHRPQIDLVDAWGAWRVERGEAARRRGERRPQGGGGPSGRAAGAHRRAQLAGVQLAEERVVGRALGQLDAGQGKPGDELDQLVVAVQIGDRLGHRGDHRRGTRRGLAVQRRDVQGGQVDVGAEQLGQLHELVAVQLDPSGLARRGRTAALHRPSPLGEQRGGAHHRSERAHRGALGLDHRGQLDAQVGQLR